jgi:hypothetical protein
MEVELVTFVIDVVDVVDVVDVLPKFRVVATQQLIHMPIVYIELPDLIFVGFI